MIKPLKFFKQLRPKTLGMAVCISGLSLGMFLDFFFKGSVKWSTLFMAMSILLITEWKNIFSLNFPSFNVMLRWIFLFQMMMLFYGIMSDRMTSQFLFFHLYILSLCLALGSINTNYDIGELPKYTFWMLIPSTIFATVVCAMGLMSSDKEAYLYRQSLGENFILDSLSISAPVLYMLFSIMCVSGKTILWKLAKLSFAIMAIYVLLELNKRTPIFIFLVGIVCYLFVTRKLKIRLTPKGIRIILLVIVLLFVSYNYIEFVQEKVDYFAESFYNGVLGLLGIESASYSRSVEERLVIRDAALNRLNNEYSIINYILGGGYFVAWLDSPLLQSYMDLGIIGGALFLTTVVVFPLYILGKRMNDRSVIVALLLSLYPMFSVFSSGHPYQPVKYVPICMLSFIYYHIRSQKRNEKTMHHI